MRVNEEKVKQLIKEIGNDKIVAATKYVSATELVKLEAAGIKYFGENRVQDFLVKYDNYHGKCKWHFIGTLQTNKVKYIIDKVDLIHSVNTLKLAKEIDKQAKKQGLKMKVLLQVNIGQEDNKHGFTAEEVKAVIKEILPLENIKVVGLMAMAPNIDPQETDYFFKKMANLLKDLQAEYPQLSLQHLSMGMTSDYPYALKNGATYIRLGRALFV